MSCAGQIEESSKESDLKPRYLILTALALVRQHGVEIQDGLLQDFKSLKRKIKKKVVPAMAKHQHKTHLPVAEAAKLGISQIEVKNRLITWLFVGTWPFLDTRTKNPFIY